MKFNYDDSVKVKERVRKLFLIYVIFLSAPSFYILVVTRDLTSIALTFAILAVLIPLYYAVAKSPAVENKIFEFLRLFNPEDVAIYGSGVFTYLTMKKLDCYVLVRDFMFRRFYICKGIEDYMRFVDRFSFSIGRIARRTKLIDCFESNGLNVRISEGEIVIPHPRDRSKVVRGWGFKVFCYRPYYTIKPDEVISLISGISIRL